MAVSIDVEKFDDPLPPVEKINLQEHQWKDIESKEFIELLDDDSVR